MAEMENVKVVDWREVAALLPVASTTAPSSAASPTKSTSASLCSPSAISPSPARTTTTTTTTSSSLSAAAAALLAPPPPLPACSVPPTPTPTRTPPPSFAPKLVLIDVRPLSDYALGHIPGAFCLRLSSILLRRFTQGKLTLADIVVEEQREHCKARIAGPCKIVAYDEGSVGAVPYDSRSTLHALLATIAKTFEDVAMLKGEFFLILLGMGRKKIFFFSFLSLFLCVSCSVMDRA